MTPIVIISRLALSLLVAVAALGMFLYFFIGQADIVAGIACALGCAFISGTIAPPSDEVQALLEALDKATLK